MRDFFNNLQVFIYFNVISQLISINIFAKEKMILKYRLKNNQLLGRKIAK